MRSEFSCAVGHGGVTFAWRGPRGAAMAHLADLRSLEPSLFKYLGKGAALNPPVVIRHDGVPVGVYEDRYGVGVFAGLPDHDLVTAMVLENARLCAGCWTTTRTGEQAWIAGVVKGEVLIQRVTESALVARERTWGGNALLKLQAPSGLSELILHAISDTVLVVMVAGNRLEVVPIRSNGQIQPRVSHALRADASELGAHASPSRLGIAVAFTKDTQVDFGVLDSSGKAVTRIHPAIRSIQGSPLVNPRCFWMKTDFVACAKEAKSKWVVSSDLETRHFFGPIDGLSGMPHFTFYRERLIGAQIRHSSVDRHDGEYERAVAEFLSSTDELQTPDTIVLEHQYLLADATMLLRRVLSDLGQFLSGRRFVEESRTGSLGDSRVQVSFSLDSGAMEAVYRGQSKAQTRVPFRLCLSLPQYTTTNPLAVVEIQLEVGTDTVPPTFWTRFLGWVRERTGRTEGDEALKILRLAEYVVSGKSVALDDTSKAPGFGDGDGDGDGEFALELGECQLLGGYERYKWTTTSPPTAESLARVIVRAAKEHLDRFDHSKLKSV